LLLPTKSFAEDVPANVVKVRDSVYRVLCSDEEWYYSGSGFLIHSDEGSSYVVTNHHVIEDVIAESIVVVDHNGIEIPAEIAVDDIDHDLCVLKTKTPLINSQPLILSTTPAMVGSSVYALGFPGAGDYLLDDYAYQIEDVTLTDGIVSSVKEASIIQGGKMVTYLQMNAAINPGSSGGPLVDSDGRVVGINTLRILNSQDVFAAISVRHLTDLLDSFRISYSGMQTEFENGESAKQEISTLTLVTIIGVTTLIIIFAAAIVIRSRKKLSLAMLMERRLHGFDIDNALNLLLPVFKSLSVLHTRGEAHLGIYPANMYIDKFGLATLGKQMKSTKICTATKPFIPPEQYSSDGKTGTWSDVYSICAVLYYLITHRLPTDAMQRYQHDDLRNNLTELSSDKEGSSIFSILAQALNLNAENRFNDTNVLSKALGISDRITYLPVTKVKKPFAFPVITKKLRRQVLAIGLAVLFVCSVLAAWDYHENKYKEAMALLESEQYFDARVVLSTTLPFYKDVDSLEDYLYAKEHLQKGLFDKAKQLFTEIIDYRDSKNMVLECDFRKASSLLGDGYYDEAKEMFEQLGSYSNSSEMVKECDYQSAINDLKCNFYETAKTKFKKLSELNYRDSSTMIFEADYQHAKDAYLSFKDKPSLSAIQQTYKILKNLGNYKDAETVLSNVTESVYVRGKDLFNNFLVDLDVSKLYDPEGYFSLISNYKDSNEYLALFKAFDYKSPDFNYDNDMWKIYNNLLPLWDFEPAQSIILSDWFITYHLTGTWKGDGHVFKIRKRSDGEFPLEDDLSSYDGDSYYIINCILYVGYEEPFKKDYSFTFINENEMLVYTYRNGKTYDLFRQ
jgi:serine/threonine protein kinase